MIKNENISDTNETILPKGGVRSSGSLDLEIKNTNDNGEQTDQSISVREVSSDVPTATDKKSLGFTDSCGPFWLWTGWSCVAVQRLHSTAPFFLIISSILREYGQKHDQTDENHEIKFHEIAFYLYIAAFIGYAPFIMHNMYHHVNNEEMLTNAYAAPTNGANTCGSTRLSLFSRLGKAKLWVTRHRFSVASLERFQQLQKNRLIILIVQISMLLLGIVSGFLDFLVSSPILVVFQTIGGALCGLLFGIELNGVAFIEISNVFVQSYYLRAVVASIEETLEHYSTPHIVDFLNLAEGTCVVTIVFYELFAIVYILSFPGVSTSFNIPPHHIGYLCLSFMMLLLSYASDFALVIFLLHSCEQTDSSLYSSLVLRLVSGIFLHGPALYLRWHRLPIHKARRLLAVLSFIVLICFSLWTTIVVYQSEHFEDAIRDENSTQVIAKVCDPVRSASSKFTDDAKYTLYMFSTVMIGLASVSLYFFREVAQDKR